MRTNLKQGENLIFWTKKHWLVMMKPTMFLAGAVFLTIYLYSYKAGVSNPAFVNLLDLAVRAGALAVLAFFAYFVYSLYEREFNIWAVTDRRVIDEWGVFSHNVKESPLEKINNVSYRQDILGLMLDEGTVEIQTAAEQGATLFTFVTSPKKLHESIVVAQENIRVASRTHNLQNSSDFLSKEASATPDDAVECPYCAELIRAKAKICKHCGKWMTTPPVTPENLPGSGGL